MTYDPSLPNWQLVLQAIEALGGRATVPELEAYFRENFPDRNVINVRPDTTLLTVNANTRVHYSGGKLPRRTDAGNKYDKLFRRADGSYELYDPKIHGVWEIAQDASGTRSVRQATDVPAAGRAEQVVAPVDAPATESSADGGGRFALEAHLRDYLAQNLATVPDLPSRLTLFVDESGVPGVEYRTEVGVVDILARGDDGAFYVLELKLGRGPDAALGQTLRYMGWVRHRLAGDHAVYGVVIAAEISDKLRYAASVATGIFLMEYDLKVALRISKPVGA
ncbi:MULTISPECIES: endonuclease NucS domain-containing protein [unclassified Variovorax]|uniref:endonuclease NucS domain-containing protein n=1 Tax=unclassified Variovorax TaxID=663243 RepID=UPI001BD2BC0C|nr:MULTISPECIES: endonuclease NucS domain-containing protein [unclassified Variovorax]